MRCTRRIRARLNAGDGDLSRCIRVRLRLRLRLGGGWLVWSEIVATSGRRETIKQKATMIDMCLAGISLRKSFADMQIDDRTWRLTTQTRIYDRDSNWKMTQGGGRRERATVVSKEKLSGFVRLDEWVFVQNQLIISSLSGGFQFTLLFLACWPNGSSRQDIMW